MVKHYLRIVQNVNYELYGRFQISFLSFEKKKFFYVQQDIFSLCAYGMNTR